MARSSRERAPTSSVGLEPALEAQLRRPVLRALDRCRHELVERERLARVDRPTVAGGLDEIADQRRELPDRPDGCGEHALALFERQVRPRQQLDVRAVCGQRRPQLMRGVRDQLLLSVLGLVERCEHRVEVGREACQLVAAADRDPLAQVTRRAHLAHRPGERTHRAQHRIRGQPPEQARHERATERQREQQPADARDRRVRLGQRARGPHEPVARGREVHRVQPHRHAAIANVPEIRRRQSPRHRRVDADQGTNRRARREGS